MKEKDAPVELVVEVLRRLNKVGVLQDLILKLIISGRRAYEEKAAKDRLQAVEVLREIVSRGEGEKARSKLLKLPAGWRKAVLAGLKAARAEDLTVLLGKI